MKLWGLLVFALSLSAQAYNPQQHFCNLTGGQIHNINFNFDEVSFCQFGASMMDAVSLMEVTTSGKKTLAVQAFEKGITCEQAEDLKIQGFDIDGLAFEFCVFKDHSKIEMKTLSSGTNDPANAALVEALKTRFEN